MTDFLSGTAFLILIVALIIIGPILTILALNTLFPALAIPLTFGTWAATGWISWIVFGARNTKKD